MEGQRRKGGRDADFINNFKSSNESDKNLEPESLENICDEIDSKNVKRKAKSLNAPLRMYDEINSASSSKVLQPPKNRLHMGIQRYSRDALIIHSPTDEESKLNLGPESLENICDEIDSRISKRQAKSFNPPFCTNTELNSASSSKFVTPPKNRFYIDRQRRNCGRDAAFIKYSTSGKASKTNLAPESLENICDEIDSRILKRKAQSLNAPLRIPTDLTITSSSNVEIPQENKSSPLQCSLHDMNMYDDMASKKMEVNRKSHFMRQPRRLVRSRHVEIITASKPNENSPKYDEDMFLETIHVTERKKVLKQEEKIPFTYKNRKTKSTRSSNISASFEKEYKFKSNFCIMSMGDTVKDPKKAKDIGNLIQPKNQHARKMINFNPTLTPPKTPKTFADALKGSFEKSPSPNCNETLEFEVNKEIQLDEVLSSSTPFMCKEANSSSYLNFDEKTKISPSVQSMVKNNSKSCIRRGTRSARMRRTSSFNYAYMKPYEYETQSQKKAPEYLGDSAEIKQGTSKMFIQPNVEQTVLLKASCDQVTSNIHQYLPKKISATNIVDNKVGNKTEHERYLEIISGITALNLGNKTQSNNALGMERKEIPQSSNQANVAQESVKISLVHLDSMTEDEIRTWKMERFFESQAKAADQL